MVCLGKEQRSVKARMQATQLGMFHRISMHVLFITEDWNAKVVSQEIAGVTGKFGLGVQNEAGQMLTEFCKCNTLVIPNILSQQHKR